MDNARRICASDAVSERGPGVRFEVVRSGRSESAFVVRYNGRVYAFLNRCAHLGVELDWEQGQFFDPARLYLICATHGATYEPDSGRCIAGPCKGARLVAVPVEEYDGSIYCEGSAT